MKPEIKHRIDQLNNGEIPDGYKKTEFGVFPCDWETEKTFGDLFDFYGGLGKSREELGENGYPYLHYGDLHRGAFNKVSFEQYEQLPKCDISLTGKETCLMEDGDVAFLDASEDPEGTSRAVLIDNPDNKPFVAGLHIIFGKPKDNSLEKWYKQYITSAQSTKKQFQKLASGFKVYGVNRDMLPKIHVAYPPSSQEQSKIAEILMKWDKAIELYQKQIHQLEHYKSICQKNMFPSKGKTAPEWRFKGFTDAWEQRKLSDVANITKGEQINKAKLSESGTYYVLNGGMSPSGYTEEYNTKADTISISEGGNSCGFVAYNSSDFWSGGHNYTLLQPKINTKFLFQYLKRQEASIMALRVGSGLPNIQKGRLSEVQVSYPDTLEQVLIAKLLHGFDNLITLHQCKRDMVMSQRKALQQYLLNGIVRVN